MIVADLSDLIAEQLLSYTQGGIGGAWAMQVSSPATGNM